MKKSATEMNGSVVDNSHAIRGEWPMLFVQLARAINTGANLPTI